MGEERIKEKILTKFKALRCWFNSHHLNGSFNNNNKNCTFQDCYLLVSVQKPFIQSRGWGGWLFPFNLRTPWVCLWAQQRLQSQDQGQCVCHQSLCLEPCVWQCEGTQCHLPGFASGPSLPACPGNRLEAQDGCEPTVWCQTERSLIGFPPTFIEITDR